MVSGDVTITSQKFIMPETDVVIKAIFEQIPPTVTSGSDSTYEPGSGKGMTIKCSGALEDFTGILIDGEEVASEHYTVKSGSTILTLSASYLDTLPAGEHKLTFLYKGGITVETAFSVKQAPGADTEHPAQPSAPNTPDNKEPAKVTSPKTGDTSMPFPLLGALIFSAGIGITTIYLKKK